MKKIKWGNRTFFNMAINCIFLSCPPGKLHFLKNMEKERDKKECD